MDAESEEGSVKAISATTATDGATNGAMKKDLVGERRVWIGRPQKGLSSVRNNAVCAVCFNFVGACKDDVWVVSVGHACALRRWRGCGGTGLI